MKTSFILSFLIIAYMDASIGFSLVGRHLLACEDTDPNTCPNFKSFCDTNPNVAKMCQGTCGCITTAAGELEAQQVTTSQVDETTINAPAEAGTTAAACNDIYHDCEGLFGAHTSETICADSSEQLQYCLASCNKCPNANSQCTLSCKNGGVLDSASCKCSCANFWSGDECQECSHYCNHENGNGLLLVATCICDCSDPWKGDYCSECGRTCLNGGILSPSTCTCQCPEDYSGNECQTPRTTNKPTTPETSCEDSLSCPTSSVVNNPAACAIKDVEEACKKSCGVCSNQATTAPGINLSDTISTVVTPTEVGNQPSTVLSDDTTAMLESECTLECENGATLDEENCACICDSGWKGSTCSVEESPVEEAVDNFVNEVNSGASKSDVAILVDTSGSIGPAMYDEIIQFLKALIGNLEDNAMDGNNLRIALTCFSDHPILKYNFDSDQTKERVLEAISNIEYSGGTTFLSEAFQFESLNVFPKSSNVTNKYLLLFSDGMEMSNKDPLVWANTLKLNDNVEIWVFCPSEACNESLLTKITSPDRVVYIPLSGLERDLKKLIAEIQY